MRRKIEIGIIGDFNPLFEPHQITNTQLRKAGSLLNMDIIFDWLPTSLFDSEANANSIIKCYDGFWVSPGSPYVDFAGALHAIKKIRNKNLPLFGTCAGCQHILLEFLRNVMGIKDAVSEQYVENKLDSILAYPKANQTVVINRIACAIAGSTLEVQIKPGTIAHRAYESLIAREKYYCRFGVNPQFNGKVEEGGLISGTDDTGELRIFELPSQYFYVATLFVPQSATGIHPLVHAFLESVMRVKERPGLIKI